MRFSKVEPEPGSSLGPSLKFEPGTSPGRARAGPRLGPITSRQKVAIQGQINKILAVTFLIFPMYCSKFHKVDFSLLQLRSFPRLELFSDFNPLCKCISKYFEFLSDKSMLFIYFTVLEIMGKNWKNGLCDFCNDAENCKLSLILVQSDYWACICSVHHQE